jgi:hypothetical protein
MLRVLHPKQSAPRAEFYRKMTIYVKDFCAISLKYSRGGGRSEEAHLRGARIPRTDGPKSLGYDMRTEENLSEVLESCVIIPHKTVLSASEKLQVCFGAGVLSAWRGTWHD